MTDISWEGIYSSGQQLNRYPFSEVVSFFFRNRPTTSGDRPCALDVGCGSGVHCAFLASHGFDVLGIDFSPSAIDAARAAYPDPAIAFRTADFQTFDARGQMFDLVVDRCASTHSSVSIAEGFYQRLRASLRPGARFFWQGFAWDNSGRELGCDNGDGSWSDFTGGVFATLGRTAFFREDDVRQVFAGYRIDALRHLSDRNVETNYNHTSWIVEGSFDGEV